MIKSPERLEMEGILPILIKATYGKSVVKIMLHEKHSTNISVSTNISSMTRVLTAITPIQYSARSQT